MNESLGSVDAGHGHFDTDVLVVGAGPMGASTALALATYGVRVRVITRYPWLSNSPRAHITNQRAMEVARDLGIEEELKQYGSEWDVMGDTLFTTSLAGEEIARIRTWGTGDARRGDYLAQSPTSMLDLPQPLLEGVLIRNAGERGAVISFNTDYRSHTQDEHGVTTVLVDRLTGREYAVRSKYLVGADGARSKIVEELGLPLEGELGRGNTAYVQFKADLSRYVAHRPSVLYWIASSSTTFGEIGMGLLRMVRPWDHWIAGWGYDPAEGEPEFSDEAVTNRIRTLIGDPDFEIEIGPKSTWLVNRAHVSQYSLGRVFCGGDAVHRHPPSGGLGSNTCVQDAFNLAWKLAYVIRGEAGPELLGSYSDERVPVGQHIVKRANESRIQFAAFNDVIRGEDPERDPIETVRATDAAGAAARSALHAALELKNYEFNGHGVESNQRYTSSAVIPDENTGPEEWSRDGELYAQPTTRPGAKLPHVWLVSTAGTRVSTLDLVGHGMFTLVTGLSGAAWAKALSQLKLPFLNPLVIGSEGARDLYGDWHRRSEISEAGALLVRPDGYVAWRQTTDEYDEESALKTLRSVLQSVLGKEF